jgi:hypothetical protein
MVRNRTRRCASDYGTAGFSLFTLKHPFQAGRDLEDLSCELSISSCACLNLYFDHLIHVRHSLQSEEGLRRFQAGDLAEIDQEWHRLLPDEAREALGKQEVQRQSVIFEVIKAERDYVADLEAVEEVR